VPSPRWLWRIPYPRRQVKVLSRRIAVVAPSQPVLDRTKAMDEAFARGIALRVYLGWDELITDVLFDGDAPPRRLVEKFGLAVYERLMELEVSPPGLTTWRALVRRVGRRPS